MFRTVRMALAALPLAATALGCGWFDTSAEEPAAPAQATVAAAEPATAAPAARPGGEPLAVGRRFDYVRTVLQELTQDSPQGPRTDRTKLDLLLSLSVEEIREGRTRIGVTYHRIRYAQELGGTKLEYDSSAAAGVAPPAVAAYAGLVENGFSFWRDARGEVVECVGFGGFLQRCARDLPADQRGALNALAGLPPGEAVAQFVDEGLGLLTLEASAADRRLAEGRSWLRERQSADPIPLAWATRYTLKSLDADTAHVDVLGTISPATDYRPEVTQVGYVPSQADVALRSGHSFGHCEIDLATGLPRRTQVESLMTMAVTRPDGGEFEQRKRTVTTLEPLEAPALR